MFLFSRRFWDWFRNFDSFTRSWDLHVLVEKRSGEKNLNSPSGLLPPPPPPPELHNSDTIIMGKGVKWAGLDPSKRPSRPWVMGWKTAVRMRVKVMYCKHISWWLKIILTGRLYCHLKHAVPESIKFAQNYHPRAAFSGFIPIKFSTR